MTGTQLVYGALRLLGVLRPGMGANTASGVDGLLALNDLLETWSIENLTVYDISITSYPLVPNQQVYTFGPGGNFASTRPNRITAVNLIYPNGGPSHLPIRMLSVDEWRAVRLQNIASPIPTMVYIDGGFPLLNCYFLPLPNAACSVEFYMWVGFTAFSALNVDIELPPGYARALRYNLAVDMAPSFAISAKTSPLYAGIEKIAMQSKAAIQSLNLPAPVMMVDPAIARGRLNTSAGPNILTGFY